MVWWVPIRELVHKTKNISGIFVCDEARGEPSSKTQSLTRGPVVRTQAILKSFSPFDSVAVGTGGVGVVSAVVACSVLQAASVPAINIAKTAFHALKSRAVTTLLLNKKNRRSNTIGIPTIALLSVSTTTLMVVPTKLTHSITTASQ